MTQERMMKRTAENLCRMLGRYDIKATPDERVRKIEDTLRMCWYVPRIKEMGFNECIYINMPKGMGFFIVTDTCEILTASNIMICDAIYDIMAERGCDDYDLFYQFKWHGKQEYEGSETGIIATELTQLNRVLTKTYELYGN
jgi:hypothetical protein